MAGWPFAAAPVLRASWERNDKKKRISKNPRLSVNRGFFAFNHNERNYMKTKKIALKAEFGAETRFELSPVAPFHVAHENEFERLKGKLLAGRLQEAGTKWDAPLRDAAGEAAALAWTTPIPLLVFPVLFEEKAAAAVLQTRRQARILKKSRELLTA
jgi:hypothetical protein